MQYDAKKLAAAAQQSSTAALLDTREKVNNIQDNQVEDRILAERMNGKLDSVLSSTRSLESATLQKEVVKAILMDVLPRFLQSAYRIDNREGSGEFGLIHI